MKLLQLKLTLLCLCFTCLLQAQDTLLINLKNLELETEQDYLDFEPEILKCTSVIQAKPLGDEEWELIKKVILYWMDDNPKYYFYTPEFIKKCTKENPGFRMVYFAGAIQYILTEPTAEEDMAFHSCIAGVEALLDYYRQGKSFGVKRDDEVQKLLHLQVMGELGKYIKKHYTL